MKKLFLSILFISLFLVACEQEDVKPFEGTFSGIYTGDDTGTWEMNIIYENGETAGTINGTFTSNDGGKKTFFASVDPNGLIVGSFVDENVTSIFDTRLDGEIELKYKNGVSGKWFYEDDIGDWIGERN